MDRETRDTSVASRAGWEMPIIDTKGVIVGWTAKAPNIVGVLIHHPEAERLLAGRVAAAYVGLKNTADAMRAGAPLGWRGPWRCLALCSHSMLTGDTIVGPETKAYVGATVNKR